MEAKIDNELDEAELIEAAPKPSSVLCGALHPNISGVDCIRAGGVCVDTHIGITRNPLTSEAEFEKWPA